MCNLGRVSIGGSIDDIELQKGIVETAELDLRSENQPLVVAEGIGHIHFAHP